MHTDALHSIICLPHTNTPLRTFATCCMFYPPLNPAPKTQHKTSGKYLNVIRACAQPVPPCPDSTLAQLRYDAAAAERGSPPFLAGIQAALSAAAGALLSHMTGPQGRLLSWLACLKHFFLLDQVHTDSVGCVVWCASWVCGCVGVCCGGGGCLWCVGVLSGAVCSAGLGAVPFRPHICRTNS